MVKNHSDSEREETCCRHMDYSFRLAARVILCAPSHRQDSTYHGLCYTSCGLMVIKLQSEVPGLSLLSRKYWNRVYELFLESPLMSHFYDQHGFIRQFQDKKTNKTNKQNKTKHIKEEHFI